jgi:hypothetical protein
MKIFKFVADGLISMVDPMVEVRVYKRPRPNGFSQDSQRLAEDVRVVGRDIKKTIGKHGRQQPYKRSSA